MKETKQASGTPEARAAMHEMMAAFEAFKGANDARLDEIERKSSADALLEEKVARIDQAVASAQARLDRVVFCANRHDAADGGFDEHRPGLDHLSFGCADRAELETWAARLDELGIAHGGIVDAHYGSGLSFRDPDGIALELFAPPA